MTQPALPRRGPGVAIYAGAALIAVSLLAVVAGVGWGTRAIAETAASTTLLAAPGEATMPLDVGDYALWTADGDYLFEAAVTITGPSGPVPAEGEPETEGTTTLSRDDRTFNPQVGFTVPSSGTYTVAVDDTASATQVLIGPAPDVVSRDLVIVAIWIIGAGLVAVSGLILLLIGRAKRRPVPRPHPLAEQAHGG